MSEIAYEKGRKAYREDAEKRSERAQQNPYVGRGSDDDAEDWYAGYDDAREEMQG